MFDRARWRLTLWFTAVFAVILLLICGAVYLVARQSSLSQVRDDLQTQSNAALGSEQPTGRPLVDSAVILRALSATGAFYVFVNDDGEVLQTSDTVSEQTLHLPEPDTYTGQAVDQNGVYKSASTDEGDQLRVYIRRAFVRQGPVVSQSGYLMIGRSIEPELQALRRLMLILIAGGVIGLLLAAWGGYWLAGRALRPIQSSMDAQRKFVADASHELRTPLSLIRANAEMVKRSPDKPPEPEFMDDIIKETDRLSYLVGQMLTLARADSGGESFVKEPVDMSALAEDITRRMKLLAAEKDISVYAHTNGKATVYGDEQRLGELLLILLDNSIKYTDRGGKVDVKVGQQDGRVNVSVTDNGRGIPPEAIPQVFERFYRADKARSREMGGTGLGLAIAKWITDGHSGRLNVKSAPEQGTTVTVELPAV
jgi:signal transduction histidine kinase